MRIRTIMVISILDVMYPLDPFKIQDFETKNPLVGLKLVDNKVLILHQFD